MASSLLFKALVGATTVGTIGGAGVVASYMLSGETIRAHIENSNKYKNKVFLTADNTSLSDIKEKYKAYTGTKRPKPSGVTEEHLVEWCSNNADSKFKDENDDNYKNIFAWCFINTNTLTQEMSSNGKQFLSDKQGTEKEWQDAWENYKNNKVKLGLEIKETAETDLNKLATQKEKGGPALQKWCNDTKTANKKLYDGDTEETYAIFETWCTVPVKAG